MSHTRELNSELTAQLPTSEFLLFPPLSDPLPLPPHTDPLSPTSLRSFTIPPPPPPWPCPLLKARLTPAGAGLGRWARGLAASPLVLQHECRPHGCLLPGRCRAG